ncbi:TPA: hypothetical protein N0F65_004000 [Lagenidium giganteum]|uniref:Uncharacterized protein n=1 Tax=Lagenidium giganteum TaxID=4803 RepID=A0AAV2YZB9_9STRA|nr:TPA: hypothetical protein N0F65_004000 [Lagenidium giganteum]
MSRSKRSRSTARAPREAPVEADEQLMQMDPSLMTERQQLAFLLRTTAQPSEVASDATEDEGTHQLPKKAKRITQSRRSPTAKTLARQGSSGSESAHDEKDGEGDHSRPRSQKSARASTSNSRKDRKSGERTKKLLVQTSDSAVASSDDDDRKDSNADAKPAARVYNKSSPSSTNDPSHMKVFDSDPAFWSIECALCSGQGQSGGCFPSALFLCASCDQKYPTQRALGIV